MPANLPPQYFDVEKKLKTAKTSEEKIAIMEELLSIIPKHKGTEKLQALYKTKIAKLKSQSQKKASISRHEAAYTINKSGAGQKIFSDKSAHQCRAGSGRISVHHSSAVSGHDEV